MKSVLEKYLCFNSKKRVTEAFLEKTKSMTPTISPLPKETTISRLKEVLAFIETIPDEKLVNHVCFGHIQFGENNQIIASEVLGLLPLALPNMRVFYEPVPINQTEVVQRVQVVTNGEYYIHLDDYLCQYFGLCEDFFWLLFVHTDDETPPEVFKESLVTMWKIFIAAMEQDLITEVHKEHEPEAITQMVERLQEQQENIFSMISEGVFAIHLN